MIRFCQTAQCRTRFILEHFGEDVDPDWSCANCDACDAMVEWEAKQADRPSTRRTGDEIAAWAL
jgi:superfamily II DNA helicase RecQ